MAPHVVIARHLGDYASLYQAADKYLDQADADERATPLWQSQKQAVTDGLAKAKAAPSKAPQTDGNDPVAALLNKTSQATASATGTDDASVASNARAMLDAQANAARDAGTTLVFDPNRKVGQQADFSQFDNQTLAIVTLNSAGSFSPDEARAAKKVLDQRNRQSILAAFNTQTNGDVQSQSLALLSHYSSMSAAEKGRDGLHRRDTKPADPELPHRPVAPGQRLSRRQHQQRRHVDLADVVFQERRGLAVVAPRQPSSILNEPIGRGRSPAWRAAR